MREEKGGGGREEGETEEGTEGLGVSIHITIASFILFLPSASD